MGSVLYEVTSVPESFSFDGIMDHPIKILVANATTGEMIYEGALFDFDVDWPNQQVTINSGINIGDIIKIFVYEIGGGNQLNRTALYGSECT